jgi:hypothetical protein
VYAGRAEDGAGSDCSRGARHSGRCLLLRWPQR